MDGATTTIKSRVHDVFQHTDFWHERYDGRAIVGPNYKDFLDGVERDEITRRYDEAKANGEQERVTIWAYVFLFLPSYILPPCEHYVDSGIVVRVSAASGMLYQSSRSWKPFVLRLDR